MLKRLLALLPPAALGLGIAAPCHGQQPRREITGVVTDTALRPIPNATVLVVGTEIRGLADAMGRYRLCNLPTPTPRLKASFINYRPLTKDSVALRDSVTVVDFRLVTSPITLNMISIPANRYLNADGRITYTDGYGRLVSLTNDDGRPPSHPDSAAIPAPAPPPTCQRAKP